jgi:hypothetical protein
VLPTVTTKQPFLGFSGLILILYPSTFKRALNFSALFLNTPHDLHASIITSDDDADDAADDDAAAGEDALTAFDVAFACFTMMIAVVYML